MITVRNHHAGLAGTETAMHDLTESRSFIPGWIVGCGTSLLLVLGYTLIAWSH